MYRIIVAEDDFIIRHVYADILDGLGHESILCQNGKEAVDAFMEKPADMVILDINMPVMDGLTACQEIRRSPDGIKVPIIIVSGNNTEDDISAGLNAGANDYMLKPVKEAALIAKLKNFLKLSSLNRKEFDLVKNHVIFINRYKIERVLGYGTHSMVFLAEDLKKNEPVAIKLLNENVSGSATLRRFIDLVQKFQKVECGHLVRIIDYGQFNEQIFLVLEYAGDGDLRKHITCGRMDEIDAVRLGACITDALIKLDQAGLCHLDIKPENIIIKDNVFKLTDFGMVTPRETATIPLKTEVWSTIPYACPECFTETEALTIKSDIYSLGVTLYEAVTGDNPFVSEKPTLSMYRQVNLVPTDIKKIEEGYSCEFSDLIASMLHKVPDNRPALDQIAQWFKFIGDCYASNALTQLTFVKPELMRDAVFGEEAKPVPRKVEKPVQPRRKDTIWDKMYHVYSLGSMTSFSFKQFAVLVMIIVLVIAGFNFVGLKATSLFAEKYSPVQDDNLPLLNLKCCKCGTDFSARTANIEDASCPKCKSSPGFRMHCNNCNNEFPLVPPEIPDKTTMQAARKIESDAKICPSCHSPQAYYVAPPTSKQENKK